MSSRFRAALVCGVGLAACVPTKPAVQANRASVADSGPEPASPNGGAPLAAARDGSAQQASVALDPPASAASDNVAPARSSLPSRARVVDPKATSGLVDFVTQMPHSGLVWLGPLAGNGGRDALVYVPADPDPSAAFVLVYHFHGTHSESIVAQQPGMAKKVWVGWDRLQQTIDAVTELQAKRKHNVVLVYPLSAGKRPEPGHLGWFNKEYDRMWMRSAPPAHTDDFDTLHGEVTRVLDEQLGVEPARLSGHVIAEGHSAGGIALRNVAKSGTRNVDEYLFLDASFQGWADGCHRALAEQKIAALVSIVITIGGIADPFGKSDPWCETSARDAEVWEQHHARCEAGAKKLPGIKKTCAELRTIATDWPLQRSWCDGFRNDLREVAGAYLLRTKVPHGKQPRHFVGGLELPDDRGASSAGRP